MMSSMTGKFKLIMTKQQNITLCTSWRPTGTGDTFLVPVGRVLVGPVHLLVPVQEDQFVPQVRPAPPGRCRDTDSLSRYGRNRPPVCRSEVRGQRSALQQGHMTRLFNCNDPLYYCKYRDNKLSYSIN